MHEDDAEEEDVDDHGPKVTAEGAGISRLMGKVLTSCGQGLGRGWPLWMISSSRWLLRIKGTYASVGGLCMSILVMSVEDDGLILQ